MLVITRYRIPSSQSADWVNRAEHAITAISQRPGFIRGWVGRATDDIGLHTLTLEFDSVGAARRALSNHDVRYAAWELLGQAFDEPTSFEVLVSSSAEGIVRNESAVAADADIVGLGFAAGANVDPA